MPILIEVYDNEGETIDRYTVVYQSENGYWYVRGMSDNPNSPAGFDQLCCEGEGDAPSMDHTGKKVCWSELPAHIQKNILRYV
jgi:hypothetical protein